MITNFIFLFDISLNGLMEMIWWSYDQIWTSAFSILMDILLNMDINVLNYMFCFERNTSAYY